MRSGFPGARRVSQSRSARRRYPRRLVLEELEPRTLLSTTFIQTNLVTDDQTALANAGLAPAARTDANLVNPWGMALGTNSRLWVAENGTGMAESFDGSGQAIQAAVTIPGPGGTAPRRPPASPPTPRTASSSRPGPRPVRPPNCSPPKTAPSPAGTITSIPPTPSSP